MFVNLVNTDIPFAEYQFSQDKIDAMKFRLLIENPDMEACDLTEQEEPDEMYRVFLFRDEDTLFMLVVPIYAILYDRSTEMLRFFDMGAKYPIQWTFNSLLDYLKEAYQKHPNNPITGQTVFPQEESYWAQIIETLREDITDEILSRRIHPSQPDEKAHHYEDDAVPSKMEYGLDLTPEEEDELEYLMTVVMKMVFNYDYSPKNDVYTFVE